MKPFDVIVVGGGIVGASILYRLTEKHVGRCLLLEKSQIAGQTTQASAGMVRVFHSDPILAQMSAETVRFLNQFPEAPYHRTGSISILPDSGARYAEKLAGYLKSARIPTRLMNAEEANNSPWGMRFRPAEKVFFESQAGWVEAVPLTHRLIAESVRAGATVLENQGECLLQTKGCVVTGVVTEKRRFAAKLVINAAGPWAEGLLRSLGAPLGVKHKSIQANYYELDQTERIPCFFDYTQKSYGCSRALPKGTQEVLLGVALTQTSDLPLGEQPICLSDRERAFELVAERIPKLSASDWTRSRRRLDAYADAKRGNLGLVPGYQGIMAAYGWGGTAVKLSRGIANRAAQIAEDYLQRSSPAHPLHRGIPCQTEISLS